MRGSDQKLERERLEIARLGGENRFEREREGEREIRERDKAERAMKVILHCRND